MMLRINQVRQTHMCEQWVETLKATAFLRLKSQYILTFEISEDILRNQKFIIG